MKLMHPHMLWLLLLIVPLIVWYVMRGVKGHPGLRIPSSAPYAKLGHSWREWLLHASFGLRMAALACLVVILARPQDENKWQETQTEGIDIVITLDISSTMLARDLQPDRLDAAKKVAIDFVHARHDDNVGLVTFAGEAFTNVPLTNDMGAVVTEIKRIQLGLIEDGTAIGDGVATAVNRLKSSQAKSKVIILLTDGSNNAGILSPLSAADIAAEKGIKIYAIGAGTTGQALVPVAMDVDGSFVYDYRPVEMDEATLRQMAKKTGGKYFRATDAHTLESVFEEIDQLEKTELNVSEFRQSEDVYLPWALALLALLLLDVVLRYTVLRTIP
ncbi:MAG: VWA domain-containing protein [Muribaculaceae bacterium]|nr:VWA domain-containing protein [Muribaculaceae bacterium]